MYDPYDKLVPYSKPLTVTVPLFVDVILPFRVAELTVIDDAVGEAKLGTETGVGEGEGQADVVNVLSAAA